MKSNTKLPSVSIIIPAYNEEDNIYASVKSVLKAVNNNVKNYEIIVVDDGSTDGTENILRNMAKANKKIKIVKNIQNMGGGEAFKRGIEKASNEYTSGFPGDNDMSWQSLKELLLSSQKADLVSSYMINPGKRSLWRRGVSRLFVMLLNLIFNLNLKYYNGFFICKTKLLKNMQLYSGGVTLLAEVKIRLIKKGASFMEIPFEHTGRQHGNSKAFTLKNIQQTFLSMLRIAGDIYLWRIYK